MRGHPVLWAAAGAAAGYWLPSVVHPLPGLRPAFGVEDRTQPGSHVALTFDDGPHADGTPAVLEALPEHLPGKSALLAGLTEAVEYIKRHKDYH